MDFITEPKKVLEFFHTREKLFQVAFTEISVKLEMQTWVLECHADTAVACISGIFPTHLTSVNQYDLYTQHLLICEKCLPEELAERTQAETGVRLLYGVAQSTAGLRGDANMRQAQNVMAGNFAKLCLILQDNARSVPASIRPVFLDTTQEILRSLVLIGMSLATTHVTGNEDTLIAVDGQAWQQQNSRLVEGAVGELWVKTLPYTVAFMRGISFLRVPHGELTSIFQEIKKSGSRPLRLVRVPSPEDIDAALTFMKDGMLLEDALETALAV